MERLLGMCMTQANKHSSYNFIDMLINMSVIRVKLIKKYTKIKPLQPLSEMLRCICDA